MASCRALQGCTPLLSPPSQPTSTLLLPLPLRLPLPLSSRLPAARLRITAAAMAHDSSSAAFSSTNTNHNLQVHDKLGVRIERNPSEARLSELGVRSWPKWGCPPSKFPWTYSGTETCYLLKGRVKVYPQGSSDYVEFGAGDLVVFPNGMSCTWEVAEAVDKHYSFS